MRGFVRLLHGAGLACLLGTIVLCQSVLAHNDGRGQFEQRANGRRSIHHYELVRVQKVSPELNEYTYRAWLTNFGAPLTGATATVTSLARGTRVVDATLTFGPVATGRTAASLDTFSVRHHRKQPFGGLWPELRWAITPMRGGSPSNHPPVANAGADRSVAPGARVTLDGSASSDPDHDPIHFNWTLTGPIGSGASLSTPSNPTTSFMPDRRGTYEAQLIVDDGSLPSAPDSVVITVANSAPVANAGPDQTALVTHIVTLDGNASSDPDGDAVSYQWALTSRPAGSAAVLSDPSAVTPTFLVDRPGTYTAQLIVSDGSASSAADSVTVTTVNTAPAANAGPDQTAAVGATVSLNGSGSSDADGDALGYAWTLQSVPAGSSAALTGAASVTPSFAVDRAGTYVVRLVVTDGQVSSAPDTVTISTVNSAPVANAGADQTALVTQTVTLNGGASSDVDGDALTSAWAFVSRPAGSAAVLSGAGAVQPTFVVDRPGLYQVRLIVNDGALSSAADVVEVQTVNSAPVANAGPDQSAYVGQTVTLDGSASTDVDGNPLGYVWALTSRPAGSAAAVSDPTAVQPAFVLDRAGVYVAQLIVNDGTVSSAADTVTVTTLNSAPVANAGADVSVIAGRTVTLIGDGSSDVDGDLLAYSWALIQRPAGSTATLSSASSVAASFGADRPGIYIAQLIVNDGSVDSAPDTVTITTGNTAPVADAGADQPGRFVGGVATVDGTASSDTDGHSLTYRWSLLSVPAGSAASLSDPNVVSPWFTLDRAGQYVAQLIVNDGFQDSAPDTVVVTVVNRAPVADAGSDQSVFTGSVATLSGAGSNDPDGDVLTYQWAFTSVPAGSAATLASASSMAPNFGPDVVGAYVVSLTVTDPSGASSTDSVTVNAFTPATVTVAATDASASEAGPDPGTFTFTRTGSTAAALAVQYRLSGSATNGSDYASLSGVVTIPAGLASATVQVRPVDDPDFEGAETVDVTVQPDGAYTVGSPSGATVTIADNDRPVVTIVATDASAAEAGPDTGTFTITRTGPTTVALRVTFSATGSAQSGNDYVALGTQVFIPAGSSTVTLTVTPIADGLSEANENVDVFLTGNSGLTVGTPGNARVVIAAN
ncbi:MAG TPA: PKD domain-containing protein [Vicinamibacterales bacterium]|nr:PKD domain-containing protein [Vicinamibacterales bacterium]